MKHKALGWACTLNDLFVRFPYEKFKSLMRDYKTKLLRRLKVKQVFRAGVQIIINDLIENNNTFKILGIGWQGGEMHFEAITGEEFERVYAKGKFKGVDFLESLFTGYLLYLYIHGKHDNFLHKRKFPVYFSKNLREKLVLYTNEGRGYC